MNQGCLIPDSVLGFGWVGTSLYSRYSGYLSDLIGIRNIRRTGSVYACIHAYAHTYIHAYAHTPVSSSVSSFFWPTEKGICYVTLT